CDWTFGTMYAIHIEPKGSTYSATREEFVSRAPLPLTDVVINQDGAMYFTVGGRGTQSELYRVTYTGKDSTQPASPDSTTDSLASLRQMRRKLEVFHQKGSAAGDDLQFIQEQLSHPDRFIRYAARVALENQPAELWQDKALDQANTAALIQGVVAVAHQGAKGLSGKALQNLLKIDWRSMDITTRLDWLRAMQLVFLRLDAPAQETAAAVLGRLDPLFPDSDNMTNRELINLLVYLQSPTIAEKAAKLLNAASANTGEEIQDSVLARNRGYGGTISQVMANRPDAQKIHYLFALRNLKDHWTLDARRAYFTALNEARGKSGGASYQGFLNNIEKEAYDNAKDTDRLAIEAMGLRKPAKITTLPKPAGPGKAWTLEELASLTKAGFSGRNFENGKKSFAAARCVVCHRFNGEGGATGPDLSQVSGRFSAKDLCESIIEPNKVISDQYKASIIETHSGKVLTGKVVSETPSALVLVTDPEDSTKVMEIRKSDVESIKPSPVSLMPAKLIDGLNQNEVLDLLAYMLSRGDPAIPSFRK
ncbi:MAG: c-type cytochrome, partial [Gemmataceae bacterium]